jgi:hypothetical protein
MANNIPNGAILWSLSAAGTTGAVVSSVAGISGRCAYLAGFSYQGSNATAAQNGVVTTTAGNLSFAYPTLAAAATTPQPPPLTVTFNPAITAGITGQGHVVTGPALGAGAPVCTVSAWGYYI